MEKYLEERAAMETKYSDLCKPIDRKREIGRASCFLSMEYRAALKMKYSDLRKPLYEERGNVVAVHLDDEIERIHKEGGGEKEEEGPKGDDDGDNAGEGE